MLSNLEKYKGDLKKLIGKGELLHIAMQYAHYPDEVKKELGKNAKEIIKNLPNGQRPLKWYSLVEMNFLCLIK